MRGIVLFFSCLLIGVFVVVLFGSIGITLKQKKLLGRYLPQ